MQNRHKARRLNARHANSFEIDGHGTTKVNERAAMARPAARICQEKSGTDRSAALPACATD